MRRLFLVVVLVLAGCSGRGEPAQHGPVAPIALTAELTSPIDIDLRWTGEVPGMAAQIVEFATAEAGPWTVLEFLPPTRRSYTHPDLMPQTPFHHRVRPVLGPASSPVDVRLSAPTFDPPADEDVDWAAPRTLPGGPPGRPAAPPTGLRATVRGVNAVNFTWQDSSSDEQGYLIEALPQGATDWAVAMVVAPDVNSVGLTLLENERTASFRVRAYHYGAPSNITRRTTGGDPL